jgi:type I restriction enzyme S subunit
MSRIENLLLKHCPDGVEYRTLGELEDARLVKLGRGAVISKTDLMDNPGEYPVYSSSASLAGEFGRYGKYMFDDERITWSIDGGGRFFYRAPHRYSVTNVCGWMTVDSEVILTRFLYYALISAWAGETFDYTRKAHPSVIRTVYRVPVPPLEVQREIVRILDMFQSLEAELEAELEARRRQYAHYRDSLLDFTRAGVRWMTLGEVGELVRGNGMPKSDFVDDGVGCIHYGQIYTRYGTSATTTLSFVQPEKAAKLAQVEPGDVIITNTSENLDDVCKAVAWLGDSTIVTGGHATVLKHQENSMYLAYYFQTRHFQVEKNRHATGTKVIDVSAKSLAKIRIPVPSLDHQQEIVAILDKFDALVSDLSVGLPAELAARRSQYEYYRDCLLTFEEAA